MDDSLGESTASSPSDDSRFEALPPLVTDRAFLGLSVTQFLGAFNDNLYKQLILVLAVPVAGVALAAKGLEVRPAAAQSAGSDAQGWALFLFSIPFVLFSGLAGYLSDKYSKTLIIVLCKVAEIGITLLAMLAFLMYDRFGAYGTWTVLFLMGTHSAFFGPGKYGILPELFRARDLATANGIILMTTFLAIIFGTVAAGALYDGLVGKAGATHNLWIGSLVCVGIAVMGTISATFIRRTPVANPDVQLTGDILLVASDVRKILFADAALMKALFASCVFWLVAGLAMPTINSLGLTQLRLSKTHTSFLTASIAIGIMLGAVLAGLISRRGKTDRLVTVGMWGILGSLIALGMWERAGTHVLGMQGSILALILLGIFSAIYSVPLQVFLQQRPPAAIKGRMIGTMNLANFIGILIAGPLYQFFEMTARWIGWPVSSVFWMIGALVLPLALFYRLDSTDHSAEARV